jgi:hypothetical protein
MPRKRRPSRATRRAPRRPEFSAGPQQSEAEPEERTDLEGNPIFADDAAPLGGAGPGAFGDATGPVETRPEWINRPAQQPRRQPGRRTAQLRQRGTSEGAARILAGQLPTFERSYIADELRRIVLITGSLLVMIIILAIVMR